jgi:hypothetical protein
MSYGAGTIHVKKRCCTCGRYVPLTEFNKRRASLDGLQSRCRSCFREWYERNREMQIRRTRANADLARKEIHRRLGEWFDEHPCVDCGEADVRVLEFDHRDPATKSIAIGRAVMNWSWTRIVTEIAKCDVRCANCHRRRTAGQFGTWREQLWLEQGNGPALTELVARRLASLFPVVGRGDASDPAT